MIDTQQEDRPNTDPQERTQWLEMLYYNSKTSARRRDFNHSLTISDLEGLWVKQQGRCHWFGIPLGPGHLPPKHPQKVSLDRLDSTQGYTPENVVLCCFFANMGRHTATAETYREFINQVFNANQPN